MGSGSKTFLRSVVWKMEGYVVERRKQERSGKWVKVTKDFRFERVETTTNEAPNDAAAGLATIELHICRAERRKETRKCTYLLRRTCRRIRRKEEQCRLSEIWKARCR